MVQYRVSFFKDLTSSDGHLFSSLQQSIEISGAENVSSAVESAKRRYEQLRRVCQSGRSAPTGLRWRAKEKGPPTVPLTMNLR
jgi:hypothetical protein